MDYILLVCPHTPVLLHPSPPTKSILSYFWSIVSGLSLCVQAALCGCLRLNCATSFNIYTRPVNDLNCRLDSSKREYTLFRSAKWAYLLGIHSLCVRCFLNLPQGVWEIQMELSITLCRPMTEGSMGQIVVFEILSKMLFSVIYHNIFQNIYVNLSSSMTHSCIL